ncbi:MAG: carboxypeptidase-like regulatory domain-containing protein [Cytophagales bacterium]|nr:carboxypeptidase-like regulatory domain-containing protein [Cytophagales bacterium]
MNDYGSRNRKISGTVKDAESSNPVEFATVALVDPKTNKPVDGTIADAKGKFIIRDIANGSYLVNISFIGFETIKREVQISDSKMGCRFGYCTSKLYL